MKYDFGEFESSKELNKAAEGLKEEGDTKSLYNLAAENGIDEDDVTDYINGDIEELSNDLSAALGKLQLEEKELNAEEIMKDWIEYIRYLCMESDEICRNVKKSKKSVKGCIGKLLEWSFKNCKDIDGDIKKAAGITNQCKLGIPGMRRAKEIIKKYYEE